jgi:DNA (cytosine-5)-methyltransferase 1
MEHIANIDTNNTNSLRLIDAFSGAGGMTLGFVSSGRFRPVWANDFDEDAVATYNKNFGPHCIYGDILDLLSDPKIKIPKADIVIGGPPCQGFSLLNKERDEDCRKQLWIPFLELVERSKARVFVMENVPQLLGSVEHEQIVASASEMGFKLVWGKLCAADYGVAQVRHRAFIIGCKHGDPARAFPPPPTHYDPKVNKQRNRGLFEIEELKPWETVRAAIGDLPLPVSEFRALPPPLDLHVCRNPTETSLRRYAIIPPGGNRFDLQRLAPELTPPCWIKKTSGGTDLFGRLWWDRPALTIRTEFFKPEKGRYLHPEQHRPITHREAARLQSFPDDFQFCGNKTEVAKQIGNAVPPRLASHIADMAFRLLVGRSQDLIYDRQAFAGCTQ